MTVKDRNNIPKLLRDVDGILDKVAGRVGAYLEAKLVEMIDKQHSNWKPLDPQTVKKKGSTKIWVDSSELRSLIAHRVEGRTPKTVKVGIFEHQRGLIAHFLEFGTKDIPERPLFRLVFDLEKDRIGDLIDKELSKELQRYLF